MSITKGILLGLALVGLLFYTIKVYVDTNGTTHRKPNVKFIVRVAVFGSISVILYTIPILHFSVPIFPSFLEMHFDEIPVFIAGFAYGPWVAFAILVIKAIIKLPLTTTLCVGEFVDLVYSSFFIIPASIIYQRKRTFNSAIAGLIIGTLLQIVVSIVLNIYVMIPFYMFAMGYSDEMILSICQFANPNITNIKWSFGLLAILPFNILKDAIVIFVTLLVYKSSHKLIDKLA